jgi:predicted membrane channel-forming protein YqfA (hemolysin III family)
MSKQLSKLEKRIRLSAIFIFIALIGTLGSLLVAHPLSFIEFAVVGLSLMTIGIVYYLIALVRGGNSIATSINKSQQ